MKNEEKLDFLLEYLNISPNELAQKFEIGTSIISQWRNSSHKKFKKLHQYALKEAFNIPLEVFDSKVNSKEEIVSILNKSIFSINKNIDIDILEKLEGSRYCYSYNNRKLLIVNKLSFLDNLTVLCYENNNLKYYGKVVFLDKAQLVITLSSKEQLYNVFLIFDTEYIINNIFYATVMYKDSYSKEDIIEFIILSKNKLSNYDAKKLLDNPDKKKLIASSDFLENIKYYSNYQLFFNSNILDFLEGTWNLYFKSSAFKDHKLIISDNYQTFWYKSNELSSKGILSFDKRNTIIKLKNRLGNKSYFIFDNQKTDIKVFAFKSYIYATKEEIVGVGIMSKNTLDDNMLDKIFNFNDKFHFNINRFKSYLEDVKNDYS